MKAVLIGLIFLLSFIQAKAETAEISGPGLQVSPQIWENLKSLDLALPKNFIFEGSGSEPRQRPKSGSAPYTGGLRLVGSLSIALYTLSGEETFHEAFLTRRAGKTILGIRGSY